jgi:ATP-dependent Clp protease ATP-binding subunit ClpB
LEIVARQSALRALFTRAGIDPKALAEAGEQWRQGRKANEAQAEQNWEALAKCSRDLTVEAKNGKLDPVIGRDDEIRRTTSASPQVGTPRSCVADGAISRTAPRSGNQGRG